MSLYLRLSFQTYSTVPTRFYTGNWIIMFAVLSNSFCFSMEDRISGIKYSWTTLACVTGVRVGIGAVPRCGRGGLLQGVQSLRHRPHQGPRQEVRWVLQGKLWCIKKNGSSVHPMSYDSSMPQTPPPSPNCCYSSAETSLTFHISDGNSFASQVQVLQGVTGKTVL